MGKQFALRRKRLSIVTPPSPPHFRRRTRSAPGELFAFAWLPEGLLKGVFHKGALPMDYMGGSWRSGGTSGPNREKATASG